MARQPKTTPDIDRSDRIPLEDILEEIEDSSQSQPDIEKGERIQTVEDNSLDESEDERTEQGSSPGMPGTAMESDADDADVPGIGRIVSASVLSQPGYLPPPRQKRVSHKLKVAEDVLQRLYK